MGRLVCEPFVHFMLLGATLFSVEHYLSERDNLKQITIPSERVRSLADKYRLQYGGAPSSQQLQVLIDNYIKEEVFYREALRLGLDSDDEIVRRRLVQKYEFLEQDQVIPSEPTEAQLREYYRQHQDQYVHPKTVTFTHVFFSLDGRGNVGAWVAAEEFASNLNRHGITRAVDQGDRFPGPSDFAAVSSEDLGRVFGREGLTAVIFGVPLNHWSAPLRSGFGWHTVYVTFRQQTQEIPFDKVRATVHFDYLDAERQRYNTEAFAKLRETFKIVRK